MRLRNIPRAGHVIEGHMVTINSSKEQKSKWLEIFGNSNPIHIEIGMGKGQFIISKAYANPGINYIGIERYSSVLLRAIERFDKEEVAPCNLRFIRMDAAEIEDVFGEGEVGKIYLNFSDPWPKKRNAKRRLTSKEFLNRYYTILVKDGYVECKTDNVGLFDFSLEQLERLGWDVLGSTKDLHNHEAMNKGNIMTEYEEKFSSLGDSICKFVARKP